MTGYPSGMSRPDEYPYPVSDPESEGLPGTADPDSTADPGPEDPRVADGPEPAALPADRPQGVDRWGTTAAEAVAGEPLDYKLAREEPEAGPGATARDARTAHPRDFEEEPIVADPDSAVSAYDEQPPPRVGRLVEPDEGGLVDREKDAIARDAGPAGGGPSAEEAAMHVERARD